MEVGDRRVSATTVVVLVVALVATRGKTVNAATIGASQVVTVGDGGTGGTAGGTNCWRCWGVTSVWSICIANGGQWGPGYGIAGGPTQVVLEVLSGTGDIVAAGNPGGGGQFRTRW